MVAKHSTTMHSSTNKMKRLQGKEVKRREKSDKGREGGGGGGGGGVALRVRYRRESN